MTMAKKPQIAEDPQFQRLIWRLQPIGWSIMLLIVIAGLLGAFGGLGPLNETRVSIEGMRITYERFPPFGGETHVRISIDTSGIEGDSVRLSLETEYIERMQIQRMDPPPMRTEAREGAMVYEMAAGGSGGTVLLLTLRPRKIGVTAGRFEVQGAGGAELKHFVYP